MVISSCIVVHIHSTGTQWFQRRHSKLYACRSFSYCLLKFSSPPLDSVNIRLNVSNSTPIKYSVCCTEKKKKKITTYIRYDRAYTTRQLIEGVIVEEK